MTMNTEIKELALLLYRLFIFFMSLVNAKITLYIGSFFWFYNEEKTDYFYYIGLSLMAVLSIWACTAIDRKYTNNQFIFCNLPMGLLVCLLAAGNINETLFVLSLVMPYVISLLIQYFIIKSLTKRTNAVT
jgi:hypothetical protein